MAAAIGGLGILSIPQSIVLHPSHWNSLAHHIQSVLFAALALLAIVAIAYQTNPSEASFRQYLTEQSFRRHLSRIDDDRSTDDDDCHGITIGALKPSPVRARDRDRVAPAPAFSSASKSPTLASDASASALDTRLHFHGHASISLRTPPHFVRSFGVLTIAAVTPADAHPSLSLALATKHHHHARQPARLGSGTSSPSATAGPGSVVRASWFVGLFGRWWPGGIFPFDSVVFTRDEDEVRSGVLAMRAVKQPAQLDGLPVKPPAGSGLRERSAAVFGSAAARSSSPPPLPKTASLPLHDTKRAKRFSPDLRPKLSPAEHSSVPEKPVVRIAIPPPLSSAPAPAPAPGPGPPAPTPAHQHAAPENAAVLKELVQEVTTSQAQVSDLRAKLAALEGSAADARAALQRELDGQREQKRRDDTARTELKQRMKALEDSKRHTDSTKREAEKRLKAATVARDASVAHIARLQRELDALGSGIARDRARQTESSDATAAALEEITNESQRHQREIAVAEDLLAALASRARDLEDKIAPEAEKHAALAAQAARRHHNGPPAFLEDDSAPLHDSPKGLLSREPAFWPPPTLGLIAAEPPARSVLRRAPAASVTDPVVHTTRTKPDARPGPGPMSRANSLNKDAFPTSAAAAASVSTRPPLLHTDSSMSLGNGYSFFDHDMPSLTFAPFDSASANDFGLKPRLEDRPPNRILSASLFNPLDSPVSDIRLDPRPSSSILAKDNRDDAAAHAWHASGNPLVRSRTFPVDRAGGAQELPDFAPFGGLPRSADGLQAARSSRAGLNPDAKVFNPIPPRAGTSTNTLLPAPVQPPSKPSSRLPSPNVPYSAAAVAAPIVSAEEESASGSFFSSLRAFAPSPAEREALARALAPLGLGAAAAAAPVPAPAPAPWTSIVPVAAPAPASSALAYTAQLAEGSVPLSAPFPPLWAPPPPPAKVRLTAVDARTLSDGSSSGSKAI